ncbi:hypothetical protein DYI95_000450 [Thermaerobacter sp. PB12/4term]|uniref:hypothetical protein n=1 Tax=Thermaerobacter sp. PB12/4term TaxID=2293838 RepID=UPI000E32CC6F|nr:hypothetical protein [Thermaerobacter sp. PB12/4term]QIA26199.1 hypothetical protein DYI95_000450 [Thermaerobacter sp. PB12/4term]
MVGEGISAALRDLAEFGWVDVPGRHLAEVIAAEARRLGVEARIIPLTNQWFRVETYSKPNPGRAWVAVRAVVTRPRGGRPRPGGAGGQGGAPGQSPQPGGDDQVTEHLVIVDTGSVVHIFAFPPDSLDEARVFARQVEQEGIADPRRLEALAGRMGGRRR